MVKQPLPPDTLIQTALEAANSALFLQSPSDVTRASKAWSKSAVLGVDTEFVRERTYFAELGLVQISDGQTVWLVDPQVEASLAPIKDLLENTNITKIFHSPSEDLEVLLHTVGALPQPILDTQIACALMGQPLQLAYHAMVRWLLDIELDNDQTRSNWAARPLNRAQLRYAALDVCLLPIIWSMLEHRLDDLGRRSWLIEDCDLVISSAQESAGSTWSWSRIRGVGRLDGPSLAILDDLCRWREEQARSRNLPRGFVIKDPVLLDIARTKPGDIAALQEIKDLHPGALRRHGETLLSLIKSVQDSGRSLPVIKQLSKRERDCLAQMKSLVGATAQGMGIEPAVLASRRELESLLDLERNQWPAKLQGWRGTLIGDEIERLVAQCRHQ